MLSTKVFIIVFCLAVVHLRATSAACWSTNACIDKGVCTNLGGTAQAGHCTGAAHIQCCTCPRCIDEAACRNSGGTPGAGICPGAANIKCCKGGNGGGGGGSTGPAPSKPTNTMLTGLADILRSAGVNVVEVAGWKTRGHGVMASVKGILVHHTAGPATGDFPSLGVVRDGTGSLAGPLAQLGLGRSGTWWVIAAGRCYHAGSTIDDSIYGNSNAIGIEAEGTGLPATDSGHANWPEVQYQSYIKGVKALQKAYGVATARVIGHKEAAVPKGRKIDPNFSMAEFRSKLG
ncbi:unnamed protein product [Adineta steineri]|uniref:N-acetylmuramoyl-L-alanine amidase domain-containing protein n=1 Tax=Adineta steineri TaxID=433720 RepID=A0A818Y4N1_9BILA|nr:unnamed protein product [Adineta steineri]CAF3748713.1 unnamed protein product [Adineta steineri]